MSTCPNGHIPVVVRYDANGRGRWCGQCGAPMIEERVSMPHPSGLKVAFWAALKTAAVIITVISLAVAVSVGAALLVYLLSLLEPLRSGGPA